MPLFKEEFNLLTESFKNNEHNAVQNTWKLKSAAIYFCLDVKLPPLSMTGKEKFHMWERREYCHSPPICSLYAPWKAAFEGPLPSWCHLVQAVDGERENQHFPKHNCQVLSPHRRIFGSKCSFSLLTTKWLNLSHELMRWEDWGKKKKVTVINHFLMLIAS